MKKFTKVKIEDISNLVKTTTRSINALVWHCSATPEGREVTPQEVETWHKNRGFAEIGYNLFFALNGDVFIGRDWNKVPAHVVGFNSKTLGFCYAGGLDKNGKPKDTRTPEQIESMLAFTKATKEELKKQKGFNINIKGHRDYSPDKNGNGKVDPWEYLKACPSFDVQIEIVAKL